MVKMELFGDILHTVINITYTKCCFEYLVYQEKRLNLKITVDAHIQYFIYRKQADT
jgi:hypothetical protein